MRPLTSKVVKSLVPGTLLVVADNSKAKVAKIITPLNYKGVKRRLAKAGVGDIVAVSIVEGDLSLIGKVMYAIIIRQKKEYKRPDGTRIKFEDNACVILKDRDGTPAGTIIRGPVAREVAERWSDVAKLATIIV